MELLSRNTVEMFLERFLSFSDSLIRHIDIKMAKGKGHYTISMIISVRDSLSVSNNSWVNVRLQIQNVSEFRFEEAVNISQQVISDGISIIFTNDQVFFDFEYSDTKNAQDVKKSTFYVGGGACYWITEDYSEY